jgi:lipid-A-disaccharide synthase
VSAPFFLYVVAGEESGDARGAELIRALKQRAPQVVVCGAGGPRLRGLADGAFLEWTSEAVVGLWDVVKKLDYFTWQFERMLEEMEANRPDALLLVDYPGFNLRLAAAARRRFPDLKIIYYISPQVWAWNRGRIGKMAGFLDLMLCIFPFEKELYEASGLKTEFVGHPMLDTLAALKSGVRRKENLVGLFPGSRTREVKRLFPLMLEAARLLSSRVPNLQFEVAASSPAIAAWMLEYLNSHRFDPSFCRVGRDRFYALTQEATAGMVCSGTATLEAAYFGLPMVILYKVAWVTWLIGKQLVKVPHIGMPNVLAGREVVREFLQGAAKPKDISFELARLLLSKEARLAQQEAFERIINELGEPGAGVRAAEAVACSLKL